MEKGIIKKIKIQDKIMKADIKSSNGKYDVDIPLDVGDAIALKNKECLFTVIDNKVIDLVVDGRNLLARYTHSKKAGTHRHQKQSRSSGTNRGKVKREANYRDSASLQAQYAVAPYNFVPLTNTVIDCAPPVSMDRYWGDRFTGFIDIHIETLTPVYIGDTNNEQEERKAIESDQDKATNKFQNPDFFSPGGVPKIPGSSLRGMTRSLLEMVSFSQMEFVDNQRFFYRMVAEPRYRISNTYRQAMRDVKPGWLEKEGNEYVIYPTSPDKAFRIKKHILVEKGLQINDFSSDLTIYFRDPGNENEVVTEFETETNDLNIPGRVVAPGALSGSYWIVPENKADTALQFAPGVLDDYRNDEQRAEEADLLKRIEDLQKAGKPGSVPCFFKAVEGKVVAFGHTRNFRMCYRHRVHDHLPAAHKPENRSEKYDMANVIFGKAGKLAGRVFFEDAWLIGNPTDCQMDETYLQILSSPKPTTFQHYLEQPDNKRDLKSWEDHPDDNNNKGLLRGYKLYWHRKTPSESGKNNSWNADTNLDKPHLHRKVKPIKTGTCFSGRIRFENLTGIELGALLFVLDLPGSLRHKIGMGKPLGLGSIKITPSLTVSIREKTANGIPGRYQKLFGEESWHLAEEKRDIQEYKDAFAQFILKELGVAEADKATADDLWKQPPLQELTAVLDFDNTALENWNDRTRYMEIERRRGQKKENEFKERHVLPPPSRVRGSK